MTRTHVANGQSIERYIPNRLKNRFYRRTASHMFGRHNGLDPYEFSANGLVLYVPLWAEKTNTFKSIGAIKHTCTNYNTIWVPTGRYFDGSDDYVSCGVNSTLDMKVTNFTVILWLNSSATTTNKGPFCLLGSGGANTANIWLKAPHSKVIIMSCDDSAGHAPYRPGGTQIDTLGWVCIATTVTWSSSTGFHVYLNGVLDDGSMAGDLTTFSAASYGTLVDCRIGRGVYANQVTAGYIGETWLYNRVLSVGEILHLYNSTKWRYQ